MPLKLRPTGLVPGSTRTGRTYSVYTGEWDVGRIYQRAADLTVCAGSGRGTASSASPLTCAPTATRRTLDGATAQFELTWRQWLAWAKLREDTQLLRRYCDLGNQPRVIRTTTVKMNAAPIWTRIRIEAGSRQVAEALCSRLRAAGETCLVQRN